jgi:hypothetical protein
MSLQVTEVDDSFIAAMDVFRQKPDASGIIEAGSKSLPFFAEHMLGIRLYSWQVDFLTRVQKAIEGNYWTREFCVLTSRQIGKTTAASVLACWVGVYNKVPGTIHNHSITGIISAADKQAKVFLYEIKKLLRAGDQHMATYVDDAGVPKFGKEFFTKLLDDNEPNNTEQITFKPHNNKVHGQHLLAGSKSGSVIHSYAPTATILGRTFTVIIIDEAGWSEKISDQVFYDFIYPTGNACNAIRIYLSTPWQASGFFYRYADPDDTFGDSPCDRLAFTIDAIKLENPKYHATVLKLIEQQQADGKNDEVQRGYYVRFVKGDSNFFDPDRVKAIFTSDYTMEYHYDFPCDMGIDFGGQTVSRTVITISTQDKQSGRIRRLYHRRYEVGEDLSLIEDVAALMKDFNIQRIIPDDCPAGWHVIRQMEEKGWPIEPMNFKADKTKKYGGFRASVHRGLVESYQDNQLQVEMLGLEISKGKVSNTIQHAPGLTDDMIDSFVMSCYFYVQDDSNRVRFIQVNI